MLGICIVLIYLRILCLTFFAPCVRERVRILVCRLFVGAKCCVRAGLFVCAKGCVRLFVCVQVCEGACRFVGVRAGLCVLVLSLLHFSVPTRSY